MNHISFVLLPLFFYSIQKPDKIWDAKRKKKYKEQLTTTKRVQKLSLSHIAGYQRINATGSCLRALHGDPTTTTTCPPRRENNRSSSADGDKGLMYEIRVDGDRFSPWFSDISRPFSSRRHPIHAMHFFSHSPLSPFHPLPIPLSPGLHSEVYRAPMVYFNFGAQGRIRYRPITHRGFLFGNFQWKLWSIIKDDMPIPGVPFLAPSRVLFTQRCRS